MTDRRPDIGYIPTPPDLLETILTLAEVTSDDVLYDLGSGDGRIVIQAAQTFGTRGVGIDIDPVRIQEATHEAERLGVSDRVTFRQQDLFETNFQDATVVILYLLPHLNLRLRPQLFRQLKPGARIVSRDFDMGDWPPQRVIRADQSEEPSTLYYWIMMDRP